MTKRLLEREKRRRPPMQYKHIFFSFAIQCFFVNQIFQDLFFTVQPGCVFVLVRVPEAMFSRDAAQCLVDYFVYCSNCLSISI